MSPSLLLIPFRVLGPTLLSPGDFGHYFLKEISAEHRALTTFCRRFFGSLRHARLTAIKSAFGYDIIQSTPLCQNNNRPRKSNLYPLFFQNPVVFFWIHKFFSRWHDTWRAKVNSTSLNRNN